MGSDHTLDPNGLINDMFRTAVEVAYDGVTITDAELDAPGPRILYANPAFLEMTGYREEDLIGQSPRILQGPETSQLVLRRLRRALEAGEPFEGSTVNYRRDGTPFDLEWRVTAARDASGEIRGYVAIQRDVTRENRIVRELGRRAGRDPVTLTLGRRGCERALEHEFARVTRYGLALSILRLDIDRFSAVNAEYGHAFGDTVLRRLATAIERRLRRTDLLGRWGGAEFLAILPHTAETEAVQMATALCDRVREERLPRDLHVTASVGVAQWRSGDDVPRLLDRCAQAVHAARDLGRDRVEIAD